MRIKKQNINLIQFIIVMLSVMLIPSSYSIRIYFLVMSIFVLIFSYIFKLKKISISIDNALIFLFAALNAFTGIISNSFSYSAIWFYAFIYCLICGHFLCGMPQDRLLDFLYYFFIIWLLINVSAGYLISERLFQTFYGLSNFNVLLFHKNGIGFSIVIAIPILMDYYYKNKKLSTLIFFFMSIFLILLSQSTASIILALFAILLGFLTNKVKVFIIKLFPLIVVLFSLFILYSQKLVHSRLNEFFIELTGKSLELTGRVDLWIYILSMIQEKPLLGYGYRGFWFAPEVMMATSRQISWMKAGGHAHNGYFEVLLSTGLIGILILAYILYRYYKYINNNLVYEKLGNYEISLFILITFSNFFDNRLSGANITWCLLMLIINNARNVSKSNEAKDWVKEQKL
ncbi:MAG: O-antigen ligase family protein [Lachnospiraceae bacterium]|nr:O-antigen ligase family protein [Lachnospiraceae bacterium]